MVYTFVHRLFFVLFWDESWSDSTDFNNFRSMDKNFLSNNYLFRIVPRSRAQSIPGFDYTLILAAKQFRVQHV